MAQITRKPGIKPQAWPEVLTLSEAAGYLRVAEAEVTELAEKGDLPGRKIRSEWRFRKQAISDWLQTPSPKERLLRHAGIAKDDPYIDSILESVYRERGRAMVEDEE